MENKKPKQKQSSGEPLRRSRSETAQRTERGRWSSQRKMDVVLRILRGEDLDTISREVRVTVARLTEWRDDFLVGGQAGLKSRQTDPRDEEIKKLRAKVGELTMDKEVLEEFVRIVESRPQLRRPKP